jgi:hypothetical protein
MGGRASESRSTAPESANANLSAAGVVALMLHRWSWRYGFVFCDGGC